jgi:UDP-N-acetylglucosamine transferase subunit ALG13
MSEDRHNQKRTAIVYFGSQQEDYLKLVQTDDRSALIQFIQRPLQEQLGNEMHHTDCSDPSRYTVHGLRQRRVQG